MSSNSNKYGYPKEIEGFFSLFETESFENETSLELFEDQLSSVKVYIENEYLRIFGTNKRLPDDYIKENIFPKILKKINEKQQVKINLCSVLRTLEFLVDDFQFVKENYYKENIGFTGFKDELNSFYYLIDDYIQFYSNYMSYFHNPSDYLILMRRMEAFNIYDSMELASQILHGKINSQYYSMSKVIPGAIPFIRQTIELVLKNSLNIHKIKTNTGAELKISGFTFLNFFIENEDRIKFPAKFSLLKKVYEWSNYFVHSGDVNYYWTIYEAQRIIYLFFPFKKEFDKSHYILFDKQLVDDIENILSEYLCRKLNIKNINIEFHPRYEGLRFEDN